MSPVRSSTASSSHTFRPDGLIPSGIETASNWEHRSQPEQNGGKESQLDLTSPPLPQAQSDRDVDTERRPNPHRYMPTCSRRGRSKTRFDPFSHQSERHRGEELFSDRPAT